MPSSRQEIIPGGRSLVLTSKIFQVSPCFTAISMLSMKYSSTVVLGWKMISLRSGDQGGARFQAALLGHGGEHDVHLVGGAQAALENLSGVAKPVFGQTFDVFFAVGVGDAGVEEVVHARAHRPISAAIFSSSFLALAVASAAADLMSSLVFRASFSS